jgi:hypothetical protein
MCLLTIMEKWGSMAIIEDTKETMLRSDLWNTMSMSDLIQQQDLMIAKISALQQMVGINSSPSLATMYHALEMGFKDLNKLIDSKSAKEK